MWFNPALSKLNNNVQFSLSRTLAFIKRLISIERAGANCLWIYITSDIIPNPYKFVKLKKLTRIYRLNTDHRMSTDANQFESVDICRSALYLYIRVSQTQT